ncbi:MAG: hypothetical protein GY834_04990 [Bacteroidetes bacterium]|nr:hypothetical protein [Bacteroidota bacterium]
MSKEAKTTYGIHSLLSKRWSPRAFKKQPISREILLSLFEALSVIVIGYLGDAAILDPRMQKPELAERERKSFDEFIFQDKFGKKSNLLTD